MKERLSVYLISWRKICTFCILFSFICVHVNAQSQSHEDKLIRYVATEQYGGAYENDGLSWDSPKNKVQLAINDLHKYMKDEGITTGGKVFVKEGIYLPTESTDQNSVNVLNTSFLIYEGITIYGGFPNKLNGFSNEDTDRPKVKVTKDKYHYEWEYECKTILTGSHAGGIDYKWNETTQQYDVVYSGNSYHVVWFATNGFKEKQVDHGKRTIYRADSLHYEAGVDGCVIEGGNASYKDMLKHYHAAYGGGAYMVKNSFLRNCELTFNSATRRGGAVFMDGGGKIEDCYIHRNQCPGLGGVEGYGGGVAIDLAGSVTHSAIVNNFARIGGGLALSYDDEDVVSKDMLLPAAMSSLIANNTASQEAGGLFFNRGGSVNHLTVVRNRCNGTDVTIKGVRYGRSAGAYVLECGNIYNSVFWGGQVDNNRNVQMAQHSSSTNNNKIRINYSAIENHDVTEWTGVVKVNVLGIESENISAQGTSDLYPNFKKVSPKAGILVEGTDIKEGKNSCNVREYFSQGVDWQPLSTSALRDKSVQVMDLHDQKEREYFDHINNKYPLNKRQLDKEDFFTFDPRDVVGAYYAETVVVSALGEGVDNDKKLTVFVDPKQATLTKDEHGLVGNSWTNPLNSLNMALDYFRSRTHKDGDVWKVVVKEGTLTTVGKYYNRHMRSSYIDMASHVTVEGGYSKKLKGVDLTSIPRNALKYRTVVSGNITEDAYENNVCHIVTFYNVIDAVMDGFHLDQANAVSTNLFDTDPDFKGRVQFQHGGGVICWNTLLKDGQSTPLRDMKGNALRNCVISNCSAYLGSAVYLHAEKGTSVHLKMENCIVHNNTSVQQKGTDQKQATIYVGVDTYAKQNNTSSQPGEAILEMNHCDIIKNVGHPIVTEVNGNSHVASVKLQNSMVWANASVAYTSSLELADPKNAESILKIGQNPVNFQTGCTNCVFDQGTIIPSTIENSVATLTYKKGTKDVVDTEYPDFLNPTVPVGVGEYGDVTIFGGVPDFTPKSMNPVVNRAAKGASSSLATDMVGNPRTAGGLPDVGALENMLLPEGGNIYYVRPADKGGDDTNDGLSWGSPFASLSHALTMANSGNQIWVAKGTYIPTKVEEYGSDLVNTDENGYLIYENEMKNRLYVKENTNPKEFYTRGSKKEMIKYTGDTTGLSNVKNNKGENQTEKIKGTLYYLFTDGETIFYNTDPNGNNKYYEKNFKYTKYEDATAGYKELRVISKTAYMMKEGVNVYGGFPNVGNPSMRERKPKEFVTKLQVCTTDYTAISNKQIAEADYHKSTIQKSEGRVLTQRHDFQVETVWDGFTLCNGFLHSAYRQNLSGRINNIRNDIAAAAEMGGAGAYLKKNGVLENCEITHNMIFVDPGQKGKNLTLYEKTGSGGFHVIGAGVCNSGGTLKNCRISNNAMKHRLFYYNKKNYLPSWMYGGGLFQSEGTVYNTIISDNLCEVINPDDSIDYIAREKGNQSIAGAGLLLITGNFYNNTISGNRGVLKSVKYGTNKFKTHILIPGVYVFNDVTMYNCIVAENTNDTPSENKRIDAKSIYGYPILALEDKNNITPAPGSIHVKNSVVQMPVGNLTNAAGDPQNPNLIDPNISGNNADNDANIFPTSRDLIGFLKEGDYHLAGKSPCINTGTIEIKGVTIPKVDADYTPRIKDCSIDIGAFEYNGAYDITPNINEKDKQFIFYVSQNGAGVNSGASIANAACGTKLQLVLDAAGRLRYKLMTTPEKDLPASLQGKSGYEIVVRLAGNTKDQQGNLTTYAYQPQRSTDGLNLDNENPRSWSLMVPNGVTLQGGWTTDFENSTTEPYPNVTGHPTYITGQYDTEDQVVNVYHAVTFTQNVYDEEQGILKDEQGTEIGKNALSDEHALAGKSKIPRAVLCGLFIENGMADGELPEDNYGGAAVVTGYAHVRNCILQNNFAYEGGGALSLAPKALVSGSLFKANESKLGGAIYVESVHGLGRDGETPPIEEVEENSTTRARIYTSTVVDNKATKSGGGLYFTDNLRVNSCVFWNNHSSSQADVAGVYEKNKADEEFKEEAYPFAYSAVESLRLPGLNNRSVSANNDLGVRFDLLSDKSIAPYYGLTDYSILLRTGMPIAQYQKLVKEKGLAPRDFERTARYLDGLNFKDRNDDLEIEENKYIDVGARSLGKRTIFIPQPNHVLRRIYVSHPDKVDIEAVHKVQAFRTEFNKQKPTEPMPLNAELGGSFSYPMQSLDDALHYIITARKDANIEYKDKSFFEVFVSGGSFYPESSPLRDSDNTMTTAAGDTGAEENFSRSNTFLVPEGVAIMGGVNPRGTGLDGTPNLGLCQDSTGTGTSLSIGNEKYVDLKPKSTAKILRDREWFDLNSNDIYEPWEMKEQTIFSGKNINKEGVSEVYHVVMVSTDPNYVGYMGQGKNLKSDGSAIKPGVVRFDGIQISDGKAWHDPEEKVIDSPLYLMDYVGGGIYASGVESMSQNENGALDVKFRPIHVKLSHCRFIGNRAGWGGALMVNLPCEIASCSFERNEVDARIDPLVEKYAKGADVKGMGSAVFTSNMTLITNSLFANNEARSNGLTSGEKTTGVNSLPKVYGAGTLAVFAINTSLTDMNVHGKVSMLNCNIVNNKAQRYPAVFAYRPNSAADNGTSVVPGVSGKNNNALMNCIFWGNEAEEAKYNYVINFDNEDNLADAYETLWFCAYQKGRGRAPLETKEDFRGKQVEYTTYLPDFFKDPVTGQVCNNNLYLSDDNFALDGPNFTNPSLGAGADYFLPTANWQPYRQNRLTDNGWTYLKQTITQTQTDPIEYTCSFDLHPENSAPGEEFPYKKGDYIGGGAYYTFYYQIHGGPYASIGVPMGVETYMKNKKGEDMLRISYDPNPSHDQSYIDIGLYEYQHVRLEMSSSDEEDILWVSEHEKNEANGKSWKSPTSNLQRAIETLLASRNGHHKTIRLMEGTYTPTYVLDGNLGYRIDTESLDNAAVGVGPQEEQKVRSFRILGGWDNELEGDRNVERCPSKIVMTKNKSSDAQSMKYLLDIANVQQRIGVGGTVGKAETDGTVIPVLLDGLIFVNPYGDKENGGASVHYQEQKYTVTDTGGTLTQEYCKPPVDGDKPKLSVTRCVFRQNSNESQSITANSSAVRVGKGGGRALFFNSLFHSNSGAALISEDPTHIVNCTFALNGGNVKLLDDKLPDGKVASKVYGSVFWQNNVNQALYQQAPELELKGGDIPEETLSLFNHNAYTKVGMKLGLYVTHKDKEDWTNCILSSNNSDIIYGPNFVNPLPLATKADFEQRSFKLGPSTTLLNQCDGEDWRFIDLSLPNVKLATDLAGKARLQALRVDVGAYEYQLPLQRIVYVDLAKVVASGSGDSWDQAYRQQDLQMAIDMAAVYAAEKKGDESQAYVYVKSPSVPTQLQQTLILREGVSVYGGIAFNYTPMVEKTYYEGGYRYDNQKVLDFEQRMLRERPGVASTLSSKSTIAGVATNGKYERTTVIDGFEIVPVEGRESDRAIWLKSEENGLNMGDFAPIIVRNCILHGFHAADLPIIEVQNGVLYNCLVRDNTSEENRYLVNITNNGWAVNNTFVSDMGKNIIPDENAMKTWRFNILGKSDMPTFAPYFRAVEGVPVHKTKNRNLWYQLAEQSQDIDKSQVIDLTGDNSLPAYLKGPQYGLIDMNKDLDLLGNPRRLGEYVDYGCFETWSAKKSSLVVNTAVSLYGGCHFPHPGSVVYTGSNAIEVDRQNFDMVKVPVIRPGYFLLQKGGGWYGHGAAQLDLLYAAVECDLEDHNLLSLPFDYDYSKNSCHLVNYVNQNENQILQLTPITPVEVASYNRLKRAESHYLFAADKSGCWKDVTQKIPANVGVYYHMNSNDGGATYRFTVWNEDGNASPIYREGTAAKEVLLYQANTTELDSEGKPNFTALENMGWNLVGQPYMVSRYATSQAEGRAGMDVPHVIYQLRNTGDYEPRQSWESSTAVSVGEAFFTQTAVVKNDTENLTFDFPNSAQNAGREKENRVVLRSAAGEDDIVVNPSAECTDMSYHLGADGLMWMSENKKLPQLYLANEQGTRFSWMANAPVEKDIKLGVRAQKVGLHTFALPVRDDFAEFDHVWLTDREKRVVTDLKSEEYTVALTQALDSPERFTLKFGGASPLLEKECGQQTYEVYVRGGMLHVQGLEGGEQIGVYDVVGRQLLSEVTTKNEFSIPLKTGVYIVKVNGNVYKVRSSH